VGLIFGSDQQGHRISRIVPSFMGKTGDGVPQTRAHIGPPRSCGPRATADEGQLWRAPAAPTRTRRKRYATDLGWASLLKQATTTASVEFRLDRAKLRQVRRREGRYLLRTNLTAQEPDALWTFYIQLTEVEQAFKEIKHDLAIRPILHKTEERIEAHIFVAFMAYCLQVTPKAKLRPMAGGRWHDTARGRRQVQDPADGGRAAADHRRA
jgi:hypothetical protein